MSVALDRPSTLGLVDPSAGDVLIVDDFVDTLALFEALLSEDGHRVRTAASGMRALELVDEREPELVLLDVSMPQMDGGEVLQHLRKRRGGGPAVIMLTAAKREPHAIESGLRGGADAYPTKPIDSRELLARVRAALESFRLRRQLEAQRRDHVAMLVHDLRHPLSSLGLVAELLDADDVPVEERRASVQTIRGLCSDMALLVDGVLAASRLEAGVFNVEPRLVTVGELVDRTLAAFKPLAERKRIRFTFEGSREQQVDADVVKLRQAIDNLVANAFKFTPRDGKIRLRVSRAPSPGAAGATPADGVEASSASPSGSHPAAGPRPVVIEISDSGPGVAETERATIFDRYRQGSGGRAAGGAGLGLAIARGIAEAHGGSLRVDGGGDLGGAVSAWKSPAAVDDLHSTLDSEGAASRMRASLSKEHEVANHPSAEKRNRQRIKRTLRNRAVKSAVRSLVKSVRSAVEGQDKAAASSALKAAIVALDKAATKGAMHVKAASRTVSRLSAAVHKLGA